MNNRLRTLLILSITVAFFSCQKSTTNDLREAQLCLNTSTPSAAMSCLDKISGNTSAQAYQLRCAGVFISEGYNTPSSFITALDQINNSSACAGCSSTLNAMTTLSFSSDTIASTAFSYCNQSGVSVYSQISSLFRVSTLAKIAGSLPASPTAAQVQTAIAGLSDATLGDVAVATYNAGCSNTTNAADAIKKYCAEISAALSAGTTSAQIGSCLKYKLTGSGTVCP